MAHVDLAWQPSLLDTPAVEIDPEFHGLRRRELDHGAWVDHAPGWCRGADALFARLLHDTAWSGREVRMYDRVVPEPRLTHRWRLDDGPAPPVELCEMAGVLSVRYGVPFTHVRVYLDQEQRLRLRVVDGLGRQLPEPRRRDPCRPRVPPLHQTSRFIQRRADRPQWTCRRLAALPPGVVSGQLRASARPLVRHFLRAFRACFSPGPALDA